MYKIPYRRRKEPEIIIDPWADRYSKKKHKCCREWITCWANNECICTQIIWNPIREELYQGSAVPGKLVTLDCYFVPPNILEIGLVVKTNQDLIYIFYWSGDLIIREANNVFIFPDTHLLHIFEKNIKRKFKRSIWNRNLNNLNV